MLVGRKCFVHSDWFNDDASRQLLTRITTKKLAHSSTAVVTAHFEL